MTFQLDFTDDPTAFLDAAGGHLAVDPVLSTVVASVTRRSADAQAAGRPPEPGTWWVTVRDETGAVVGVGMRTARAEPRPIYLLTMPDRAAVDLARALVDRGEVIGAVNGASGPATAYAEEVARRTGGTVRIAVHTRLFELTTVIDPAPVDGRLRPAGADDVALATAWWASFHRDADEQAGRPVGSLSGESLPAEEVARRIAAGLVWLWVDPTGRPVHLTAVSPVSFGVQRIAPVYTPREHRGHGWASAGVAEVSRRILADGARPCLFTDQANPTSNKIYQAVGFVPVVDMLNLEVVLQSSSSR